MFQTILVELYGFDDRSFERLLWKVWVKTTEPMQGNAFMRIVSLEQNVG